MVIQNICPFPTLCSYDPSENLPINRLSYPDRDLFSGNEEWNLLKRDELLEYFDLFVLFFGFCFGFVGWKIFFSLFFVSYSN